MAAIATATAATAKLEGTSTSSSNNHTHASLVCVDGQSNLYRLCTLDQQRPPEYSILPKSHSTLIAQLKSVPSISLLHEYNQGADGRVWLASYSDGTLVVVKFPYPKRSRPHENAGVTNKEMPTDEVQCWNEIYPHHPAHRISISTIETDTSILASFLHIDCSEAFIFPFVFCASHSGKSAEMQQPRFESMSDLQRIVSPNVSSTNTPTIFSKAEREEVDRIIQAANKEPMQIAEEAVDHCLQAGWEHLDVQWRHVGLIIIRESIQPSGTDSATLPPLVMQPVLIDLGMMKKLENYDAGTAVSQQCDGVEYQHNQCETRVAVRQRMLKTLICTFKDGLCHCEPL